MLFGRLVLNHLFSKLSPLLTLSIVQKVHWILLNDRNFRYKSKKKRYKICSKENVTYDVLVAEPP